MAGLVQLKVFMNIAEARIAISVLEASGIRAFLFDEHLGANIFPPASLLGVRLMVQEDRTVEAAELLEGQQQE